MVNISLASPVLGCMTVESEPEAALFSTIRGKPWKSPDFIWPKTRSLYLVPSKNFEAAFTSFAAPDLARHADRVDNQLTTHLDSSKYLDNDVRSSTQLSKPSDMSEAVEVSTR